MMVGRMTAPDEVALRTLTDSVSKPEVTSTAGVPTKGVNHDIERSVGYPPAFGNVNFCHTIWIPWSESVAAGPPSHVPVVTDNPSIDKIAVESEDGRELAQRVASGADSAAGSQLTPNFCQ
jgi:hypothetical protein